MYIADISNITLSRLNRNTINCHSVASHYLYHRYIVHHDGHEEDDNSISSAVVGISCVDLHPFHNKKNKKNKETRAGRQV